MKKQFALSRLLWLTAYILVPFAFYLILFQIPFVKYLDAYIRYGFDFRLIIVAVFIYLCFRIHGCWGEICSYWSIQLLFALSLVGLWWNAFSELQVLSGVVFFSDAFRYFGDAQLLLAGQHFTTFSTRHPLATGFFSVLSAITGNHLQMSLVLLVVFTSGCIALASREVKRAFGPLAATVFLMICFIFYRRFTGLIDTENLGMAVGCLALMFLLKSVRSRNSWLLSTGLFFQTLGLVIRPGAFLIVPLQMIWFYKTMIREHSKKIVILIACCIVIIPLIIQGFVIWTTGDHDGVPFSNYAYTLYGITNGGKGWEQFLKDYPELSNLPEPEIERMALDRAVEEFISDPELTLQAIGKSFQEFFGLGDESAYGFITGGEVSALGVFDSEMNGIYKICRACFWLMSIAGMIALYKSKNKEMSYCVAYSLLGIGLSIPFLPPQDAGMMRIYAATIPYFAILPALGLGTLFHETYSPDNDPDLVSKEKLSLYWGFTILLSIILAAGPLVVKLSAEQKIQKVITCSDNLVPVRFRLNQGSYLQIIGEEDGLTQVPQVQKSVFLSRLEQFPHKEMIASLEYLPENTLILNALDLYSDTPLWIVIPQFEDGYIGKEITACGQWDESILKHGFGFLFINPDQISEAR